jgi:hypothetical protein
LKNEHGIQTSSELGIAAKRGRDAKIGNRALDRAGALCCETKDFWRDIFTGQQKQA